MYNESFFLEYAHDLRNRLIRIFVAICIITIFCLTFSISIYNFNGYRIPLPHPEVWNNISVQTIHIMKDNLLPRNVNLIQLSPQGPFVSEIYCALILSIIIAMPIIIRELAGFIGPALYQDEKAIAKKFSVYAVGLFAVGCLFSYFIVIPSILGFLYKYGQAIGISTFFDVREFVPFVMQILIVFGLSYQLPLAMWVITFSGIVRYTFWKTKFKYAIIICTIFGALITPDGSGVTMWFIAGPMIVLYAIGMLIINNNLGHMKQQKNKSMNNLK